MLTEAVGKSYLPQDVIGSVHRIREIVGAELCSPPPPPRRSKGKTETRARPAATVDAVTWPVRVPATDHTEQSNFGNSTSLPPRQFGPAISVKVAQQDNIQERLSMREEAKRIAALGEGVTESRMSMGTGGADDWQDIASDIARKLNAAVQLATDSSV